MRVRVGLAEFAFLFAILLPPATYSQAPAAAGPAAQAGPNAKLEYSVATIKPDQSNQGYWRNTDDGFAAVTPAISLIMSAYSLHMPDQISGLPGWASSDTFAVAAKMDPETAAALEKLPPMERWKARQTMLQALLADRFGLKAHRGTKQLPIYTLTVVDAGKLKKSASDEGGHASFSPAKIEAHAMSLENLATNLSNTVGRMIANQTGLTGTYDFTLEWAPQGADASDPRPSIFTALEEQMGLKLKPSQGPVDVLVIDSIERPSEN